MTFRLVAAAHFFDPIGVALVLVGVGLAVAGRRAVATEASAARLKRARVVAWLVWGALYVGACPITVQGLMALAEPRGDDLDRALADRDASRMAVVVLSAGFRSNDPTLPASERVDGATQARAITAARVFRERGAGFVVASGGPADMSAGLRELLVELGVPEDRVVIEGDSDSTRASAANCARLLKSEGVREVLLVTSALHMPRAARWFEHAGLVTHRAPADFHSGSIVQLTLTHALPSSFALGSTALLFHELVGRGAQLVSIGR